MSSPNSPNAHQDPLGKSAGLAKSEVSLKDRFFRFFQHEITALQEQMDRLADTATVGGERSDAMDHCLAGIVRLSSEVKDASSYIPTYDQRVYAEAIKALQDKLSETRANLAPRSKFSFKTARKNRSAISLADTAEFAAQSRRHIPDHLSNENSSMEYSVNPAPLRPSSPANDLAVAQSQKTSLTCGRTAPGARGASASGRSDDRGGTEMRQTSVSEVSSVSVNSHCGVHIILPTPASHAAVPVSITALRHCAVDMSIPTTSGQPFASLAVRDVTETLLICGQVNGPAHITGVSNSVILVSCHQFRMHDCTNVDVYLSCSSKPIIEGCSNIRFGRLPFPFITTQSTLICNDLWDQIEDFKWIKPEPSPNWRFMEESDAIPDGTWKGLISGATGQSVDNILKATRITEK